MKLFDDARLDALEQKVYRVLETVGLKVDDDTITGALRQKGCREGGDGRIRLPREAVSELLSEQRMRQESARQTARPPEAPPAFSDSIGVAFSPGPTQYFDYSTRRVLPVTTEIYQRMVRFAEATPEIRRMHPWFRQDAPAPVEGIETLILGLKGSKKVTGLDAIFPNQIPYLLEIGEIVTGRSGDDSYLGGSQCMTTPLHLGGRSAGEMVERARRGVRRYYVATMPMIGVSVPVTLSAAIVIGAAEVLGGLMAAFAVNPAAELLGTSAATVLDMSTGTAAMNTPETALVDAGIAELFEERLGGHVSAHIRYAPSARVPGLQAVYENFFGTMACARLVDPHAGYGGNGNLHMGRLGSPEQAVLDAEVCQSLARLSRPLETGEEALPMDWLCDMLLGDENFLATEHTLAHYKAMWLPRLFSRRIPDSLWDGSEAAILAQCYAVVQENLSRYRPPEWPEDVLRGLDNVLLRARRALM